MGVLLVTLSIWSCSGDKLYLGADARVAFSQDTVLFDTVFSTIGSASEAFRIVNDSPGRILLEDITLEEGQTVPSESTWTAFPARPWVDWRSGKAIPSTCSSK